MIRLENAGMAVQMAEYVTLAVLRAFREADAYAAQQREGRWQPRPRLAKSAFGVGILGFGVLGQAVAGALAPFAFPLCAWSATRKELPGVQSFAGQAELHSFLAASRVLVCLLPSTPATRGLLDRANLSRLPRGAHVVNVARGEIVVDEDLVALLDEGHLAGATLDVFRAEPLPAGHPFWHHPRIVLTPHTSAVTVVDDSIAQIAAKIRRLERGEPVTGIVDRARGYYRAFRDSVNDRLRFECQGKGEVAEQVPSPCISVCVMDPDGAFCLGCFRTLDEIAAWGTLDADAKRRVLALLPAREASRRLR